MNSITLSVGEGRFKLEALITFLGRDMNISVVGGEKRHIGAVALAQPRKSLRNKLKLSATASTICVIGHKEDVLAKKMAEEVSKNFNCIVTCAVGIHIDNATMKEIEEIDKNFKQLIERINK